ncbi:MAG: DeoR/GlpR family DNA-binding transcription regulator [Clostridia bacterium]|nr:DeoR/GlpR family DNA-binding transcription regulator [Clostridia bacterium]
MKSDRQAEMKRLFFERKKLSCEELRSLFGISIETVRRDLDHLERAGVIRRVYGGAVLVDDHGKSDEMPPWKARSVRNRELKRAIAEEVVRHIPDGSTIVMDSGTQAFEIAKQLVCCKDLTVLTNDMRIAAEVSAQTNHKVFFIGGSVKRGEMFTTGVLATSFLEWFSHIDIAVMSTDGFSVEKGMLDHDPEMGNLKTLMIGKAGKLILAMDSSKFSVNAFFRVCRAGRVDLLITDSAAPQEVLQTLTQAGVRTVRVPGDKIE